VGRRHAPPAFSAGLSALVVQIKQHLEEIPNMFFRIALLCSLAATAWAQNAATKQVET
jgi:hypothetical protein